MARVGYVYVGKTAARQNWGIGIRGGVWGWETSVLDRADGHHIAGSLQVGDLFVLARGGPTPRAQPGGWRNVCLEEAWVASVTRTLYRSDMQVWPDKPYPHRIDLTELVRIPKVTAEALGDSDAMENLRLSGNKQGAPVLGQLELADEQALEDDVDNATDASPSRLAIVVVRAEQRRLRKQKFGDGADISCDLCGRVFPRRLVRAAHIKRRSKLAPGEYWNLENIMAACTFGCDEMFEHGYVYVDESGAIRPDSRVMSGSSLEEFFTERLAEQICRAYSKRSADFFKYHRTQMAQIDVVTVPANWDVLAPANPHAHHQP